MLMFFSCTSVPDGLRPVSGFDVSRYLGKWYEIARLDHRFERGLTRVSAEYTLRPDGHLSVLNRGFSEAGGIWKEALGVAKSRTDRTIGSLRVSFFGPFYGGYHILDLDKDNYRWAVVCGSSRKYLWILAREKTLEKELLDGLVARARSWGFDTEKLIFVRQD